jgi:tetratricopeptide (TPR) repeat protein
MEDIAGQVVPGVDVKRLETVGSLAELFLQHYRTTGTPMDNTMLSTMSQLVLSSKRVSIEAQVSQNPNVFLLAVSLLLRSLLDRVRIYIEFGNLEKALRDLEECNGIFVEELTFENSFISSVLPQFSRSFTFLNKYRQIVSAHVHLEQNDSKAAQEVISSDRVGQEVPNSLKAYFVYILFFSRHGFLSFEALLGAIPKLLDSMGESSNERALLLIDSASFSISVSGKESCQVALKLLNQLPPNLPCYFVRRQCLRGFVFWELGDYVESIHCFSEAMYYSEIFPNVLPFDLVSCTHHKESKYYRALGILNLKTMDTVNGILGHKISVLKKNLPLMEQVLILRAKLLALHGNYSSAAVEFRRALCRDPPNLETLLGLAFCLFKSGDVSQCVTVLSNIDVASDDFNSSTCQFLCLLKATIHVQLNTQGSSDVFLSDLKKVINRVQLSIPASILSALILIKKQDYVGAIHCLDFVIGSDPRNCFSLALRAACNHRRFNIPSALKDYARVTYLHPENEGLQSSYKRARELDTHE